MDDIERPGPGTAPRDDPRARRDELLRARGLDDVDQEDPVAAREVGADDDPADLGKTDVDGGSDPTGS